MGARYKLLVALGAGSLAVATLVGYLIWSGYRDAIHAAGVKTSDYAEILEARLDATAAPCRRRLAATGAHHPAGGAERGCGIPQYPP